MPRRSTNLYSLARGHVRSSMNKYNLFNLYKKVPQNTARKTLYQQKWQAKAETRAYHGEHLTESRWKATFEPNLKSVAQLDSIEKIERGVKIAPTPLQLQSYAVLEKRLDFALFRALFASSIRQARQNILHGYVKVNGVVIKSPGYTLKPGDVFSCEPEKVLNALGREKPGLKQSLKITRAGLFAWNKYVNKVLGDPELSENYVRRQVMAMTEKDREKLWGEMQNVSSVGESVIFDALKIGADSDVKSRAAKQEENTKGKAIEGEIKPLTSSIFESKYGFRQDVNAKLLKLYNLLLVEFFKTSPESIQKLSDEALKKKVTEILASKEKPSRQVKQLSTEIGRLLTDVKSVDFKNSMANISIPDKLRRKILKDLAKKSHPPLPKEIGEEEEESLKISLPWSNKLFGRQDISKPYFTPWQPRPFLGPFAILPHHLEISFSTCHAVYLRDPIARPGESEVITPFDIGTHERAFMYYIRKGK